MNITEASHVARLLHLLDGTYSGTNVDQVVETVQTLAERAAKPLQVRINVDLAKGSNGEPGSETPCGLHATFGKNLRTHRDDDQVTCPDCLAALHVDAGEEDES